MISIIATFKVQADKCADFEAAFRDAMIEARADKPNSLAYQLVKSRTDPTTYKVTEFHRDEAAQAAHLDTSHFKALGPKIRPCLAGPPEFEMLDGVFDLPDAA